MQVFALRTVFGCSALALAVSLGSGQSVAAPAAAETATRHDAVQRFDIAPQALASALNQFSAYLKSLGFGKGIGLHAFRHTIATELHHKGIPDEDIALLTGHSISKKVPVLHDAYFHKKPELARRKQIDLLSRYAPPVELPIYQRGQFAKQLSDPSKFYP